MPIVRSGESLAGDFDIEQEARSIPPSYVVKGMFFKRLVDLVGSDWDTVARSMIDPPRGGRYVPFRDYPQSDYSRLSAVAGRKRYPKVSLREAVRRVARDDFDVFGASTFGRVVLAVVGDARSALHRVPFVYSKLATGDWSITAIDLDGDVVRLEFAPLYGRWEYTLGQLEGIVQHYGSMPTTTVDDLGAHQLRFDVRHR